jgi:2'-5' RNA ligase
MKNHWDRPPWWPGRQGYYWYLTFSSNSALRSLSKDCQSAIGAPYFDLVPLDDLHMTICRVGFADELGPDELNAVIAATSRECKRISPFEILIGPLAGSAGAISFSVAPLEPILKVREVLQSATAMALDQNVTAKSRFRPHVGIAYCNSVVPMSDIVPRIQPLRDLPRVRARVEGASLVLLTREEQSYRWSTVTEVLFGTGIQL